MGFVIAGVFGKSGAKQTGWKARLGFHIELHVDFTGLLNILNERPSRSGRSAIAPPPFLDQIDFHERLLPFARRRSLGIETPIHCLAVRVRRRRDEQIDTDELEDFLNQTAGPNGWLMTSLWMLAREPVVVRPCFQSVPVICPAPVAMRVQLSECEDRPPRVFGEHVVGAVELRGWRWVARQVYPQFSGRFPWEVEARATHHA